MAKWPRCQYCEQPSIFMASSAPLYHGRDYGPVYACLACQAWVGCHKGTNQPLGRLANAELRKAKMAAHAAFDPLWREGSMRRSKAYGWLAKQLGIEKKRCHIGYFSLDECRRVIEVCRRGP